MKKNGMHLYQHVQDYILDMIARKELGSGDRMPAEKELADKMKVSRLTVRKAYAMLADAGVILAIQGKGTFVNDLTGISLGSLSSATENAYLSKKVIGVIFPEITSFFGPILKGIEERASEHNFTLNIMFNDNFEREEAAVKTMLANGVDGMIINPRRTSQHHGTQNYQLLEQSGIPVVMVGKPPVGINLDCVMCDDVTGTFDAIERLVGEGHRRILRLFSSDDDAEALIERKEGYREAVESLLPGERQYHVDCSKPEWHKALMACVADRVTAVFSDNDALAVQAYLHLAAMQVDRPRVHDYISYNSTGLCRQFNLDITTIEIPKYGMGKQAMGMLHEKLNADAPVRNYARYSVFRPFFQKCQTD